VSLFFLTTVPFFFIPLSFQGFKQHVLVTFHIFFSALTALTSFCCFLVSVCELLDVCDSQTRTTREMKDDEWVSWLKAKLLLVGRDTKRKKEKRGPRDLVVSPANSLGLLLKPPAGLASLTPAGRQLSPTFHLF
jgi:hypothetical protein